MSILIFDWSHAVTNLLSVGLAYTFAMPVSWEREQMRAVPGWGPSPSWLLQVAAILLARSIVGGESDNAARIGQGLMTGIGFIGGGAILKHGRPSVVTKSPSS